MSTSPCVQVLCEHDSQKWAVQAGLALELVFPFRFFCSTFILWECRKIPGKYTQIHEQTIGDCMEVQQMLHVFLELWVTTAFHESLNMSVFLCLQPFLCASWNGTLFSCPLFSCPVRLTPHRPHRCPHRPSAQRDASERRRRTGSYRDICRDAITKISRDIHIQHVYSFLIRAFI